MVVAETRAQAMDAAEAVEVEYEELPFTVLTEDALAPGRAPLWDESAGQRAGATCTFGDKEKTDRAFAKAAHVVKSHFNIGRVTARDDGAALGLGDYDTATGRYTLYCGGGGAVQQKAEIAGILGIPPDKLRVLSYDIGGNFGSRNRPYVEYGLVVWAAGKLKRPVKYTATRSEAFLTDYQGRDLVTKVEVAFDAGRQDPGDARRQHQQRRRALRLAVAAVEGLGPDHRQLRHSGRDACARARCSPTPCRPTPIARRAGRR